MRRLMPHRHPDTTSNKTRSRGQGLVEFALVLPLLLLVFAAAADFGRAFYAYVAIENAVKEGAVYGARNPLCATPTTACIDPNNVQWRVRNETRVVNQNGTPLNPSIECQDTAGVPHADLRDCQAGDRYVVRLSYQFNMITPIIGAILGNSITISSQSTATVLNQAFDPTPGMGPTKLVNILNAENAADIVANCTQPDPVGSPNFYRQPCVDSSLIEHELRFEAGVNITYKLIGINNGGSTVTGVTMSDSDGWYCPAPPASMAVDATYECMYSIIAPTPSTGTEEEHVDTFTVDSDQTLAISDNAKVITFVDPPDLRVLVYVSPYKDGSDGDGSILGVSPSFGTLQSYTAYQNSRVTPYAWFKVIVTNNGAQTATGVSITDTGIALPYGQNTTTAVCDAAPGSLAAGAKFECRYRVPWTTNGTTRTDTVTATATNVTPDSNDNSAASVTWQGCTSSSNRVVPNMIGLTKAGAASAWGSSGAQFTGTLTTWSSSTSSLVVAQTPDAFSCIARSSTGTVYKDVTP
jgi:hypothetical protein